MNTLFEEHLKHFGIRGARFVKWPKTIRIQRKKRILKQTHYNFMLGFYNTYAYVVVPLYYLVNFFLNYLWITCAPYLINPSLVMPFSKCPRATGKWNQKVLTPRVDMNPSENRWPFQLQRRQFPFVVSFVMTINKS